MTENSHMIVTAAANMFARYGYSKTTMGDIAAEAGVARQTIYNAFSGKEEILRAVCRKEGEDTYAAVMAAWADAEAISEKLDAFHLFGPIRWFEAVRATPDWAVLMDGLNKISSEEMSVISHQWRAAITEMLQADTPQGTAASLSLHDIVDFFYSTSLNAKYGVDDITQLRARLATIKVATLVLLQESSAVHPAASDHMSP
ncbi:MAG: TetR/AcrR family transcriptional regulator [Yoonia sp.]|nr:TetR/AcrR family transcriptional regulator [Yoonia sp.]